VNLKKGKLGWCINKKTKLKEKAWGEKLRRRGTKKGGEDFKPEKRNKSSNGESL